MTLAYAALAVVLAISAGALLSRWLVAGRRPAGPEANDWGWCPAEHAMRLHSYAPDDSRCCWTCHTRTPRGAR